MEKYCYQMLRRGAWLASDTAPIAGEVIEQAPVRKPRKAEPVQQLEVVVIPGDLDAALDTALFQLTPIDRAGEKLHVLQRLARTTPDPASEVLQLLIEDVVRLTAV